MDKINTSQHIARLIYKQQTSRLDEKDAEELNEWLTESDTHKALYEKLINKDYVTDIEFYSRIDTTHAWRKYNKKYRRNRNSKKIILWTVAAACFIGVIALSVKFISAPEIKNTPSIAAVIQPGSSKATLILDDGKSVDLTSAANNIISTSGDTEADNTGTQISYMGKENGVPRNDEKDVFNEIVIPRGGEYKIILSDGTSVWLNSQTKLKYPVKFTQNMRSVYLVGEAFFDVAHDAKKPFVVHLTDDVKVSVLGTSFNVRAYPDEETTETVLEIGSVKMESAASNITLQPSFLSTYNKKTKTISEKKVDTELYTAWKNGRYVFYDESIENIIHKLSRWYNIDVSFKDETVKKLTFNGNVRKYENVNTLFDAFETSGGIHFDIKGNHVTVSKTK